VLLPSAACATTVAAASVKHRPQGDVCCCPVRCVLPPSVVCAAAQCCAYCRCRRCSCSTQAPRPSSVPWSACQDNAPEAQHSLPCMPAGFAPLGRALATVRALGLGNTLLGRPDVPQRLGALPGLPWGGQGVEASSSGVDARAAAGSTKGCCTWGLKSTMGLLLPLPGTATSTVILELLPSSPRAASVITKGCCCHHQGLLQAHTSRGGFKYNSGAQLGLTASQMFRGCRAGARGLPLLVRPSFGAGTPCFLQSSNIFLTHLCCCPPFV